MRSTAACLLAALLPATALAQTVSTAADRVGGVAVTVYQDGHAQIRDRRAVTLDKGATTLVIEGVATQARPGSASLSAPGLAVRDQGFDLGRLDADRLLEAAIGREVTLSWGDGREQRALVLAGGAAPVFRVDGKVVAARPARVTLDTLPDGVSASPSWRGVVEAAAAGKREVELAYDTSGLGWQADYLADLDGDALTLSAWATLTNATGTDFPEARLRVVAGTPSRAPDRMRATMTAAPPVPPAAGPHRVYTLPRPVTLRAGETRQVALLTPGTVKADRALVLDPLPPHAWDSAWGDTLSQHPSLRLHFVNTLGQPLPAGVARVSQPGPDGVPVVLGEDTLPATPEGADAWLDLAESFDITARRSQADFQRVSPEVTEAAWEVRLANAGAKPATVTVREGFHGDWLVVAESAKHSRDGAFAASWAVTVPAKGETVLKYRVRVKN